MAFADSALKRWESEPRAAPFSTADPMLRQAFVQGSVGPDMGFMPGPESFRFVSELAHYCRPGDLARAIMARASEPEEEAYAWGWATHVIVDAELHPVIGRACGEILLGDRSIRMNAEDSTTTHVSLEVGIDIELLNADPELPTVTPRAGIRPEAIGFVEEAYSDTYGVEFETQAFVNGHFRAGWLNHLWPNFLRAVSDPISVYDLGAAALGRAVFGGATPVGATLRPTSPPEWVMDAFRTAIEAFPDRLATIESHGLDRLDNLNLETGVSGGTDLDHPPAVEVKARLEERRIGSTREVIPNEVEW